MKPEVNQKLSTRRYLFASGVSALLLLTGLPPTSAHSTIDMRLSGHILSVASDLSVVVRIEPAADNRTITVVVDSADYLRASSRELEGADAPVAHQFWFKHLPEGDYSVVATLDGAKGIREVASAEVQVGSATTGMRRRAEKMDQ
jgi:hypothetical protein